MSYFVALKWHTQAIGYHYYILRFISSTDNHMTDALKDSLESLISWNSLEVI